MHLRRPRSHQLGSSPLTRGKQIDPIRGRRSVRLIPAHAGKTVPGGQQSRTYGAHPRSRGENSIPMWRTSSATGSSPLTRGKPGKRLGRSPGRRLIPAHAGKTMLSSGPCSRVPAHPRSRGENIILDSFEGLEHGSSPLTRGKRISSSGSHVLAGLIPAHAGKTGDRQEQAA